MLVFSMLEKTGALFKSSIIINIDDIAAGIRKRYLKNFVFD
jgi:hypothetical protein